MQNKNNKNNLKDEFKMLGSELASALKQIRSSKEFNDLEREIATSVKGISSKLVKSLKAAKESKSAAKIKSQLGRVAHSSAMEGAAEAKKLKAATLKGMKKILEKMKKAHKKVDK